MYSRIFEKHGRTIDQKLVKRSASPFLKIGDTFAIFSLSGKIPVLNPYLPYQVEIARLFLTRSLH